jgi:hypothetical protein
MINRGVYIYPFVMYCLPLSGLALVARATPTLTSPVDVYFSRGLATAAKSPNLKKLPLAGVRVLDMSRVLAGVCETIEWKLQQY